MSTRVKKRHLKRFLKENGLTYRGLMKEADRLGYPKQNRYMVKLFLRHCPQELFVRLLNWPETTKGAKYWDNVHISWNTYLLNLIRDGSKKESESK